MSIIRPRIVLFGTLDTKRMGTKFTGRRDQFHTNRTYQGISGFSKRSESEHDALG